MDQKEERKLRLYNIQDNHLVIALSTSVKTEIQTYLCLTMEAEQ